MSSFISLKERRFGRNGIYWPAFIHLVCLCLFIWGDHWGAYVAGAVVIILLWVASYFDFQALGEIDHDRHDGHHVDLWDAAPYTCVHGVKPHKVTKECAWPIGHPDLSRAPTDEERRIREFRNYPRP